MSLFGKFDSLVVYAVDSEWNQVEQCREIVGNQGCLTGIGGGVLDTQKQLVFEIEKGFYVLCHGAHITESSKQSKAK